MNDHPATLAAARYRQALDSHDGWSDGPMLATYSIDITASRIARGDVDLTWLLGRAPLEFGRLYDIVQAVNGRARLETPAREVLEWQIIPWIEFRNTSGFESRVHWDQDGAPHLDGAVANLWRWSDWLRRWDHPECLPGWDEFLAALQTTRAAAWRITGAQEEVGNLVDVERAAAVAGVNERTIRRRIKDGSLRRYRLEYRPGSIAAGVYELDAVALYRPEVKAQVNQGLSRLEVGWK